MCRQPFLGARVYPCCSTIIITGVIYSLVVAHVSDSLGVIKAQVALNFQKDGAIVCGNRVIRKVN
jgi:hypothetical protein